MYIHVEFGKSTSDQLIVERHYTWFTKIYHILTYKPN